MTCALDLASALWCWGPFSATPMRLDATAWLDVKLDYRRACALHSDREVYCWGDVGETEGNPPRSDTPQGTGWFADEVAVGNSHLCLRTGTEWSCAGNNSWGQLGTGSRTSSTEPVPLCR